MTLGGDQRAGAEGHRRAYDRADIVRIGDLVEHDDETGVAERVERFWRQRLRLDDDALMNRLAAGELVDVPGFHKLSREEQGGEVLLIPADPADGEGAREAVHAAVERFGDLRGVLHIDMFPGAGLIQLKTPEASAPVLRPKVAGTRALADALLGVPIEIFVLFSSTIAVTGGLGQVDFCAANNFLDVFAEAERAAGRLPAVTLDWGSFRWEEWQE